MINSYQKKKIWRYCIVIQGEVWGLTPLHRPPGWYPLMLTIITPPQDKQLSEVNIWWLFFCDTSWDATQKKKEIKILFAACAINYSLNETIQTVKATCCMWCDVRSIIASASFKSPPEEPKPVCYMHLSASATQKYNQNDTEGGARAPPSGHCVMFH